MISQNICRILFCAKSLGIKSVPGGEGGSKSRYLSIQTSTSTIFQCVRSFFFINALIIICVKYPRQVHSHLFSFLKIKQIKKCSEVYVARFQNYEYILSEMFITGGT